MTKIIQQTEISLTDFLSFVNENKTILGINKETDIDYETIWKFVNSEEANLVSSKIISIEEKRVNSKKTILNTNAFTEKFIAYLKKQKHLSISKFIRKSDLAISYTTLYRLVKEKEKELFSKNIIEVITNGNKKTIKITSPKDMENYLRENRVGV